MYLSQAHAADFYNARPATATRSSIRPIGQHMLSLRAKYIMVVSQVGDVMWENVAKSSEMAFDQLPRLLGSQAWAFTQNGLWRVICADMICDSQLLYKRTRSDDELTLMTWAIFSRQFPFKKIARGPLPLEPWMIESSIWSKEAVMWHDILMLWRQAAHLGSLDPEDTSVDFTPHFLHDTVLEKDYNGGGTVDRMTRAFKGFFDVSDFWPSGLDHYRKDAPWRELFVKGLRNLKEHYGSDVHLSFENRKKNLSDIRTSIGTATLSRRLIIGPKSFGLGPAGTAIGDCIALLTGGKMPFVLRRREHCDAEESRPRYEIIGNCYLDGWMDWDVRDNDPLE